MAETPADKAARPTALAADDDRRADETRDDHPAYADYLELRADHRRRLARDGESQ